MADISKINVDGTPYDLKDSTKIPASQKGAANGVAELDATGKVPSSQLPSYVDDVLEYASLSNFPATGETGKIYIALDTNKQYRWSGSTYVAIASDLALGETSSTAYRGDRGKAAYDAAVVNPDSTPTENSTNLIQSGAVHTALAGKVDKNQGSGNAGKVLGINQNGMVEPVTPQAEVSDMTGATASTAGTHGLAPAPAAGQQSYVLTGDGTWKPAPGAKIQTIEVTVTNTSGAYDHTFEDDRVGADMKAILLEINNPYVFGDEIIATPGDGTIRLQCSDVCGTATVKISVIKVVMDQETVTSTEFTILNNRLSAIENVYSDFSITITPSDWTLSNGAYEYTWTNAKVTAKAAVEVKALDGAEESGIEDFDAVKVTGGVKFTAASLPTGNLPVWIRVMAVKATDVQAITGEDVATDVISGAANVNEALASLDSKFAVVTATTPSSTNTRTKVADFPEGFEDDDTVILGFIVKHGNGDWYSNISDVQVICSTGEGIRVLVSSSNYVSRSIKILIGRIV